MDLRQRISHAESAIARVQTELAALHNEAQTLQRAGYEPPSSMDASAISVAARKTAKAQAEAQQQLAGVNAAVSALQPVLQQYLRELSGLRQLEVEAQQLKAKQQAEAELKQVGEHLTQLSNQMEEAMQAVHAAGTKLNRAQGLGGSAKFQIAMDSVPTFRWDRGAYFLTSERVNFRQPDEKPLAGPGLVALGSSQQQRNEQLQLQSEINQMEVSIGNLQEEVVELQLNRRGYGTAPKGQDKVWASSVDYAIQEKQAQLEQMKAELKELKNKLVAPHA